MNKVRSAVNRIVENSAEQAENSKSTSEHMRLMGENITETSAEVEALNSNAEFMHQSSEKAAETDLLSLNAVSYTHLADEIERAKPIPVWLCLVYIVGGAAAIAFGGDMVVDSASAIAAAFGLSQNLIGLTIVAMGTSLPELVTSIVAARKNEVDMALGNVIGSNIFNILFVLGIAAAISPVAFIMENVIDIVILIAMSIMVLLFAWSRQKINRIEGAIMLLSYAGYMVYICMR